MNKKTRSPRKGIKLKPTAESLARLEEVKNFIRRYWEDNHFSPSIREIADHFQTSTSAVSYRLDSLCKSGWLEERHTSPGRGTGKARNIVPAEIFAGRSVFPDWSDFVHRTAMDAMTQDGPGVEVGTLPKEVRIEKMTNGRIAILAVDKEKP